MQRILRLRADALARYGLGHEQVEPERSGEEARRELAANAVTCCVEQR